MNPHCRIGRVRRNGMDNVHSLRVVTSLDMDPSRVLSAAMETGMQSVVVLGYDYDGGEYFSSSMAAGPEVLWLMARLSKLLLETNGR